jgi:very-short-patch-repair endonuclease
VRHQETTVERKLARIAGAAHGVVTHTELVRAGVTPGEIRQRLSTGALLREHRGVYRVGHRAPSVEARYLAAVRAAGKRAVLSGRAAAHLLALVKGAAPRPEVTTPTKRRISGVITHRSRGLVPADVTTWKGIPVTSAPRTLVDLAARLSVAELARACHEAGIRHETTPAAVEAVLARRPNSTGASKLREILRGDARITLSKLEARFLARLREAGLALPETNRAVGGRRIDCRWPEQRLTVELDGYRYHRSRHSWEHDRRREREAHGRGDDFRRYTYADVFERPQLMLAELRRLLPSQLPLSASGAARRCRKGS